MIKKHSCAGIIFSRPSVFLQCRCPRFFLSYTGQKLFKTEYPLYFWVTDCHSN